MRKYRIEKNKNIGNVIFVVEGGRPETGGSELRLLKKVFADILGYEVHELRRGCEEFIGHGNNPYSRVFALNLPKNQLTQLSDESLDGLYRRINEEFEIKPEDCPIFFLYDRDVLSYHKNELRGKYVRKYTDPYGSASGEQGQLLLSYPALESYLISCLTDNTYAKSCKMGKEVKAELNSLICPDEDTDKTDLHLKMVDLVFSDNEVEAEKRLIHSIQEMNKGLEYIGVCSYDLDDLSSVLLSVYDYEQDKYIKENDFSLLSLIGMSFLELGIIVEM